jgi:hypothetical protein
MPCAYKSSSRLCSETDVGLEPQIRQRLLPYTSFAIYYSLIVLTFDIWATDSVVSFMCYVMTPSVNRGKVLDGLNYLSTMLLRRMRKWSCSSTVLDLIIRCRWVDRFAPVPFYPRGNRSRYSFYRTLGKPRYRSGRYKKKSLVPSGNRTPIPRSSSL